MTVAPRPGLDAAILDGVALLCELALVVVLAGAGWALGGPLAVKIALAVIMPAITIGIWGRWLAPRAAHRLAQPHRVLLQWVIFLAMAAITVAVGLPWVGLGLAVVGGFIFGLIALQEGRPRAQGAWSPRP